MTTISTFPTPALPLIDGCFFIDNSSLQAFQQCPRNYQLSQINKRVLNETKDGANFGSAIHESLKYRYDIYGKETNSTFINTDLLISYFTSHPESPGDYRNIELAIECVKSYNNLYRKEPFDILTLPGGKRFVELSFARPFGKFETFKEAEYTFKPSKPTDLLFQSSVEAWIKSIKESNDIPIFYSGRIDLGIGDTHGEWIFDTKTAFQFGQNFDREQLSNPQYRGYGWEFLQTFGRMPKGYIINAIRVRKPKQNCTSDEYFRTTGSDPDFKRIVQTLTQVDIDTWLHDTYRLLEEIAFNLSKPEFNPHKGQCVTKYGPCQFWTLCNEIAPEFKLDYLNGNTFSNNQWSPLNLPQ